MSRLTDWLIFIGYLLAVLVLPWRSSGWEPAPPAEPKPIIFDADCPCCGDWPETYTCR